VTLSDSLQVKVTHSQISGARVAGDLHAAVAAIQARGPAIVVVKRGEKGATVFEKDKPSRTVPGFPVEVYNVLGAGDAFFAGCLGIFGHGCIAGIGQALQQYPQFRYYLTKNEQASVHIAAGYAKMKNRLGAFACVSSIGPGATNMVTGAALATVNRLPVLLFPGDIFARRNVGPVLQQLEQPYSQDIS